MHRIRLSNIINKVKVIISFQNSLKINLDYLSNIKACCLSDLKNVNFVEELLLSLGINDENKSEIPEELHKHCGFGLRYWQYPNQFAKLLVLLSNYKILSYLEIGVRYGGTYIIINEYLKKFNQLECSIGIDIVGNKSLKKYSRINKTSRFCKINSSSIEFQKLISNKKFDLVLIDGNHEENYCRNDFYNMMEKGNIIILHDIISDACPGVVTVWNEIKLKHKEDYYFFEFNDQYESLYNTHKKKYFGIGVAVRKEWI